MSHKFGPKTGTAISPKVLGIIVFVAAVLGAVFLLIRGPGEEQQVKDAEAAYQAANPPYVPPPPAPVIVAPADVAGPQFPYDAGPGGAPAPAEPAEAPKAK